MLHKREGVPIRIPNEDITKESKDVVKDYGLCKDSFVFAPLSSRTAKVEITIPTSTH